MRARLPPLLPTAALAFVVLIGAVVILLANRHGTFFFDDWDFVVRRRGISTDTLLGAHNGHLTMVPVAAYKAMLKVFGLEHYWPYRTVLLLVHSAVVLLVFVLVRRRAGDAIGVGAAALVMFLGAAGDDLLWAFQLSFVGSVAAGLGMLVALDARSRRGDVLAAVLLGVALASSSLGVSVAATCLVDIAVRGQWRRLLAVAGPPLALYALWRIGYGESDLMTANLDDAPSYVFAMLAAGAGGLAGIPALGTTAAAAVVVAFAVAIVRGLGTPRMLALLAGVLSFMVLTALARAQLKEPGATRYIYPVVVFGLLAAVEAWPRGLVPPRRAVLVGAALVGVACLGNLFALNQVGSGLADNARQVRGSLAGLELAAELAPAGFLPAPTAAPQIESRSYLDAVRDFGSPVQTPIARLGARERVEADRVLATLELTAAPARRAPTSSTRCRQAGPTSDLPLVPDAPVTIIAPPDQGVELRLRRFATTAPAAAYRNLAPSEAVRLTAASDAEPQRWALRTSALARAC